MKPRGQKIKDVEAQYPDQWVLIQVTKRDRYGRTTHGIVLGHGGGSEKRTLIKQEVSFGKSHPQAQTFLFWTRRLIPEGVGVILSGESPWRQVTYLPLRERRWEASPWPGVPLPL